MIVAACWMNTVQSNSALNAAGAAILTVFQEDEVLKLDIT